MTEPDETDRLAALREAVTEATHDFVMGAPNMDREATLKLLTNRLTARGVRVGPDEGDERDNNLAWLPWSALAEVPLEWGARKRVHLSAGGWVVPLGVDFHERTFAVDPAALREGP